MLGHRRAVEVRELTQRQSIGNPLAQLAIVTTLEPQQNQRAQDLSRRQSAATTSGLLQPSHQIAPDPLDHVPLVVEKVGYRPQQWLQAQALSPLLHQFPISKTDLSRRRSRHRSALLALRRFRPLSLQRLDVARRSLLQQFLQGVPIVQTTTNFGHKFFRNVDRNPPPLQSDVQNKARMLFAGPAGRAVLAHTRAVPKAQRTKQRRPKSRRFSLQPAHHIGRRLESCILHIVRVPYPTRTSQQKPAAEYAYKPAFFRANLPFATETSLVFIGFADDRRFVGLVFVLFVFVLIIIVVGISRWCRVADAAENLVDAACPLLLQTSVKLYGIGGHVVLLLTFAFEGLACSGSSPSASAQYISASFRYWRLCRSDFATTARRANSFALARYFSICDCTAHTPAALCKG